MGELIRLRAADGHELDAWRAEPAGEPRAGLVVIQEVFGLTEHIRRVSDDFAARGYFVIAPAMFDRVAPGIVLDYGEVERGRDIMLSLDREQCVLDMDAAVQAAAPAGKVGAVGYCWGGAMADLAACRLDIAAAVSYYGRANVDWLDLKPRCPVLYHFGEADPLIPPELVEQIRAARPGCECYVYPGAGHGFNCDEREDYDPDAAALALERTLDFFARYLG
ncbi:MAG: dienelactone hydrolase family protein [Gammaproteobacteria bacterium]|nr:MAG: dienelactone hydrolase family protein [Gammaproteobacteria bacterium]